MEITINGELRRIQENDTIQALLESLDVRRTDGLAVALNDRVVRKTEFSITKIEPGDRIEIIRATQGG